MDFNDYSTPVKSFVDVRATFSLVSSYSKIWRINAKLNKAILDDDYLKLQSAVTKEFFTVDRIQMDIGSLAYKSFAEIGIMLDPNRDIYRRTVFTILDLSGTIGGIFGFLSSGCGFILGLITTHIMMFSIFRRLYYTSFHLRISYVIIKKIN